MLFVPTLLCTVCLCCPRQPTTQVGCAEAHASLAKLVSGAGDAAAAESHWSSSIAAYEAALQHPAQVGRGVLKDAGGRGVGGGIRQAWAVLSCSGAATSGAGGKGVWVSGLMWKGARAVLP